MVPTSDKLPQINNRAPTIAILLGTLNGQDFLPQQLASIAAQNFTGWRVYASDDGSTDRTLEILRDHQVAWGVDRLTILPGPNRGFAENFQSMVCNPEISADYFAFSDQDDIWQQDKLSRALHWLQSQAEELPALYCSRTRLIDATGRDLGFSPLFERAPSFANALVQTIAGGNTMVFNRVARNVIGAIAPSQPIVTHDWWAYLAVTGSGGIVFYDPEPTLHYRQHGKNIIGSKVGMINTFSRIAQASNGRFRQWTDINVAALEWIKQELTLANLLLLEEFAMGRSRPTLERLRRLRKCGIYRQKPLDNLALTIGVLFKKI